METEALAMEILATEAPATEGAVLPTEATATATHPPIVAAVSKGQPSGEVNPAMAQYLNRTEPPYYVR